MAPPPTATASKRPPVKLSWDQVLAWRMHQHHLVERVPAEKVFDVTNDICLLHAQLLSSAELSLWARIDGLEANWLENALWDERKFVKTWAMRGTLHLIPARDYPNWQGALNGYQHYLKPSWLRGFRVTEEEMDALLPAISSALDGGSMLTREELAEAVVRKTDFPSLGEKLRDSWGALLKPASFQGRLCFAPNRDRNAQFTTPDLWLDGYQPVPPEEGLELMTRRYLRAFGPATREDYARWSAHTPAAAGRMIKSLGDEVTEVEVEGYTAWMRTEDAAAAVEAGPGGTVRLVPAFDPWVIGASRSVDAQCPDAFRERVYRKQGWISPVLLVDGRMHGIWNVENKGGRTSVTIEPFTDVPAKVRKAAEAEAARLAGFTGGRLELSWG
ncbi:winged helix DNA-binding domain-containing protein [Streptomyces sp. NPDC001985]|uniref:winged helix DNA-binding domain-containing protein n=1 Tax=Streptomyces sp. NPDC001985 TaxID=3154406 RepID=UPI003329A7FA